MVQATRDSVLRGPAVVGVRSLQNCAIIPSTGRWKRTHRGNGHNVGNVSAQGKDAGYGPTEKSCSPGTCAQ